MKKRLDKPSYHLYNGKYNYTHNVYIWNPTVMSENKPLLYVKYLISTGKFTLEEAKHQASRLYDWYSAEKRMSSTCEVVSLQQEYEYQRDEELSKLKVKGGGE